MEPGHLQVDVRDAPPTPAPRRDPPSRCPSSALAPPRMWHRTGTLGCRLASCRRSACQTGPAPMLAISLRSAASAKSASASSLQQPPVVAILDVVGEAGERVALGERAQPDRRSPGCDRSSSTSSRRRPPVWRRVGVTLPGESDVLDVVGVVARSRRTPRRPARHRACPSRRRAARPSRGCPRRERVGSTATAARRGSGCRRSVRRRLRAGSPRPVPTAFRHPAGCIDSTSLVRSSTGARSARARSEYPGGDGGGRPSPRSGAPRLPVPARTSAGGWT